MNVRAAPALALSVLAACFSERSPATGLPAGVRCSVPLDPGVAGSTLIAIRDFSFTPAEVRVQAGATVTWANCETPDKPAHTTTADGGGWSSPQLAPGQAFSQTFSQVGRFTYHCEPHPFMTAAVVVE